MAGLLPAARFLLATGRPPGSGCFGVMRPVGFQNSAACLDLGIYAGPLVFVGGADDGSDQQVSMRLPDRQDANCRRDGIGGPAVVF
jgi:hypothetical protein